YFFIFFFQAEDGIRDRNVTGVQTCALPISPKSVTTPIAMDFAREIGGAPSLAAVFVMIAGISGGVMGHTFLKWCRIDHFLGKGVGMGCASHAIGTSVAMANDELEGAISTVAMSLSAIVVSVITQPLIWLLL